jgi:aspartate/methionine/tyrosine aminotransferase
VNNTKDAHTSDGPSLVVAPDELVRLDPGLQKMRSIPGSRMFEIKESLAVYRQNDPHGRVFDASQGDGGASLPGVSDEILDEAHRLQKEHGTGYDKPFGTEIFRQAVVEDYWQLDESTGWGPKNIIACQGGRDALVKAYDAVQYLGHERRGDLVAVSRVPWISYNWGPYSVGANVMLAPGDEEHGWVLTPEAVIDCVEAAAELDQRRVALLVITSPDNPTGRSMSMARQLEIARAAFAAGVPFVLFDWIYHRVTDAEISWCKQHSQRTPCSFGNGGAFHPEPCLPCGHPFLPQPGGRDRRISHGLRPGRRRHHRSVKREPRRR